VAARREDVRLARLNRRREGLQADAALQHAGRGGGACGHDWANGENVSFFGFIEVNDNSNDKCKVSTVDVFLVFLQAYWFDVSLNPDNFNYSMLDLFSNLVCLL
jgi:hypothetical protein